MNVFDILIQLFSILPIVLLMIIVAKGVLETKKEELRGSPFTWQYSEVNIL